MPSTVPLFNSYIDKLWQLLTPVGVGIVVIMVLSLLAGFSAKRRALESGKSGPKAFRETVQLAWLILAPLGMVAMYFYFKYWTQIL